MGTIRNADGWSYALTSTDKLWAARMAQYEGGEAADVLWTMTQAYARSDTHRLYPTFTRFIQAYSQPINPIWRRDGSKCRPGGAYHDRDECSEIRLARRDTAATMPWSAIRSDIKTTVDAWFRGALPNPVPRAVEFAAPAVAESFVESHEGSRILKRLDNYYIGTQQSLAWPPGWVSMTGEGAGGGTGALLVAAAAGGAWWYLRSRRPARPRSRR